MNESRNLPSSALVKLTRLKALSRLSTTDVKLLAENLVFTDYKCSQLIFGEGGAAIESHILLKGIARLAVRNGRHEWVTFALLPPGPIPEFPLPSDGHFDFRCEALVDCTIGSLSWSKLNATETDCRLVFEIFHKNAVQFWYRALLRTSTLLNLDLHQRIAIALLELAADFGIRDSRGILLEASIRQKHIGELVGASRPRVSEHLVKLEREKLLIRQGRQFIVCVEPLRNSIDARQVGQILRT